MKKLFFVILALVSIVFADVNFNDGSVIDDIGIGGTYPNFKLLDSQAAGIWFLRGKFPAKWDRVRNDEFELHDAIQEAYNTLKGIVKPKYDEYINKDATILFRTTFGKYNFKTNSFPLDMVTKDTYFKFYGKNLVDDLYVYFNNPGEKERKLLMAPKQAKSFLQQRKNSNGWVDRTIYAKYYFKIKKIKTNVDDINSNTPDYSNTPDVTLIGHIYKVEIIDPQSNKVIATINKK